MPIATPNIAQKQGFKITTEEVEPNSGVRGWGFIREPRGVIFVAYDRFVNLSDSQKPPAIQFRIAP